VRHGIRACAYPAGVAVPPTSAVVAAAAVCPSRPGAAGSAVGRHTSRPGTADITVPSSPPTTPGRGSKVNGFSDVGDLAPVTVLWGLMAFTAHTFVSAKRQNRGDN
jgi:hypothetical protein